MIIALSDTSVELQASDRWVMQFVIYDDNGFIPATAPAPVVTITGPAGGSTTPDVVQLSDGSYQVAVTLNESGRSVANVYAEGYGVLGFVAYGTGNITTGLGFPTVAQVRAYAGGSLSDDWSDPDIQLVLDSEASQQRARLNIGAVYPPDLAEALKRRVVLALDRRQKLSAGESSNVILVGETTAFVPADPEIKRLENPYRKVMML